MSDFSFRRDWISKPIFRWARHVLPSLSDNRARGDRGRRRLVGRRSVHRQSRLGQAAGVPARKALGGRAGFPRRPGRRAVPHARRLAHQLGARRPAARGLGLPEGAQVLRDDHSEEVRRARIFRLCAFGGHPQALDPFAFAPRSPRWCRTRSARASCCCSSAPRRSRTTGCRASPKARRFRASGSPARRPAPMPPRWWIPAWSAAAPGRAARCSASGSTGTSATSRSARSRPCSGLPSSSTIPIT